MASVKTFRFQNAEHARSVWHVMSEHGDEVDQMMRPEYWAHVANVLKAGDKIEVLAEDNKFYAEFIVFNVMKGGAKVGLLRYDPFAENAASIGMTDLGVPDHRIEWKYNRFKWCVIRNSDGQILVKELPSEKAAQDWLIEYRKSLAR